MVHTSGSTGVPKGVLLSHRAVTASARASLDRLGGPGRWLSALPATSVGGLQVLVRSILADQEPVFADDFANLDEAIATMTAQRRYASFVPTQLYRLVRAGTAAPLRGFDAVLLGGAAIDPTLLAEAQEMGIKVVRTYGMTETSGGFAYDGIPLDQVRVRTAADGRIEVAGDVLFDGYLDDTPSGEWFTTNDVGILDQSGHIQVLGRVDDMVVTGGVNVALPAVEAACRTVPGVDELTVVGVGDPEWGQQVVAVVVGDASLDELRDAVSDAGFPRSWAPKKLVDVEALPLLPGGKIDRIAARVLAAQPAR